ncbi:MAG: hypothetical protein R3F61_33510 [Myxococcota bacterium]
MGTLLVGLALLACGATAPEAPPAPQVEDEQPENGAEDGFGESCVANNEGACVYWGRTARSLGEDYEQYLKPSCERGHGYSCLLYGEYRKEDGADASVTAPIYQRACENGAGDGCLRWADSLEGEERQKVLEKGCALQSVWSCKNAGLPTPTW